MAKKLKAKNVKQNVPRERIGLYYLGCIRGDDFSIEYVGRSDTNLRHRLMQHARKRRHSHFDFILTEMIFDSFRLECREWHRIPNLKNKMHPDAPKSLPYICPYCLSKVQLRNIGLSNKGGNKIE